MAEEKKWREANDSSLYFKGRVVFLNDWCDQNNQKPNFEFEVTGNAFCLTNGNEELVLSAQLAIEDPRVEHFLNVQDNGILVKLQIDRFNAVKQEFLDFEIGQSVCVTAKQMQKHDKTTPLTCGFKFGLWSCPSNGEMTIVFMKNAKREFVIRHIEIRLSKQVYQTLGAKFRRANQHDLSSQMNEDCGVPWTRTVTTSPPVQQSSSDSSSNKPLDL
jgi:hypothetical protein